MSVSKDEFSDWQHNPVTRDLMDHLKGEIEAARDLLESSAGSNPLADRDLVGGISALRSILEWSPEFIEGESADDV